MFVVIFFITYIFGIAFYKKDSDGTIQALKLRFYVSPYGESPLRPGSLQTFDVTIRKFLSLLYFRFAKVPNARLGHIHASMAATLALRICHHAPAASSLATWQYASSFVFSSRK